MRVSTMVRWTGLAALGLAAACSDATTAAAPKAASMVTTQDLGISKVVSTQTFDIVPGKATVVSSNGNSIYIQADALCAAGSGYGRQYFDQPCARETSTVTITATWGVDLNGQPSLYFSRDVRFSPDRNAYILLSSDKSVAKGVAIKWFDPSTLSWVDEGAYDATQKTHWNGNGTILWRRVKHFSGYNVGAGENCDPSVDPSCGTDAPTLLN